MKLPVKLLTAVAALALLVVGVVVVQNAGNTAQAAVTGSVNLTNQWSDLTTQSSPPSGRTFVGSGKTLYATFRDLNEDSSVIGNTIRTGSNVLVVSVADSDINLPITATQAGASAAGAADVGDSFTIVVLASSGNTPITSTAAEIEVHRVDTGVDVTVDFAVTFVNGGSATVNASVGLVRVGSTVSDVGQVDSADYYIEFETSAIDLLNVSITTTVQSTPVLLTLRETGRSTGVFEGLIELLDNEATANVATSSTSAAATQCTGDTGAGCLTAKALVLDNSTVTVKYDDALNSGSAAQSITQTARVEISAPVPTISSPATGSSVQVRNPSFSGSVTDSGAGLDISELTLYIDQSNDPTNTTPVLAVSPGANLGIIGGVTASGDPQIRTPSLTGSPVDGATSVSWSATPEFNLPSPTGTPLTGEIDHIVDFQFVAVDLAGNVGFSDSDTASDSLGAGVGPDKHEAHTVNIDQKNPAPVEAFTGQTWDSETSTVNLTANNRKSIRVVFDDAVSGVDNTDFEVELDSGTTIIPTQAQVFSGAPSNVFLTLGVDLPSNDTPIVRIVGQISDDAGNTASAGDATAADKLAPTVTVVLSGGSGTGTGSNGPTGLTKSAMVITITSDENLSSTPTVQIFAADNDATAEGSVIAIAQGGNVWRATFNGSSGTFFDSPAKAKKSVFVTANDNASTGVNTREVGKKDDAASGAITFTLDKTAPVLLTGDTTTSQRKPFVVIEFEDAHTVTVDVATVGGTNVLADLATTDNKKFFYVPATDLALGDLTVEGRATDLAGTQGPLGDYTLTIGERAAFSLELFAGWNAKSFPSNPIDPDISSVFTNTAIDQVVSYNAMDTASPWRIATRDAVSGSWTSSTSTPLNSIRAGNGYWIHTNNFAPQEVELEGAVAPGAGTPPPLATISTARGWNFVGVVSQNRDQTTGSITGDALDRNGAVAGGTVDVEDYFGTVNQGRVYRYDPSTLRFSELALGDVVEIGEALWVFISPQTDGSFPAIVP